jgi:hypothetical protein
MATYSGQALLLAMGERPILRKSFKEHLRKKQEHGTESCMYCRMVAEDLGLRVVSL